MTYLLRKGLDLAGRDLETEFMALARGFAAADDFMAKFRLKPCAAILHQIIKRTKTYTPSDHEKKLAFAKEMARELQKMGYFMPG